MNRILKIAQREYMETVKTKTFLLGILMVPLIIGGIVFFTNQISKGKTGPRPPVRVALVDFSGELFEEINDAFEKYSKSHPKRQIFLKKLEDQQNPGAIEKEGKNKLRRDLIDAYVVLDKNIIDGTGKITFYTHKPKPPVLEAFWTVERYINKAVIDQRCKLRNLSPEILAELRNIQIERIEIGLKSNQERVQSKGERMAGMMVPFFFMYLMFMGMVLMGQHMLSSVIDEKSSRIIEVLLSAVSPFQLMAGKIIGLGGIGMTVVLLWGVAAYFTASWQGLNVDVTVELLFYFVIYYILGFLFFSSILAGIGSICNTIKETQSLMTPIMLVFIIPMLSWFKLVQSPDGTFARVLSFLPPLTPMVMILRLSASSDIWIVEILASLVLLALAMLATIWLASKIFRTGILMYGKRPGLLEVFRWLRQS